MVATLLATIMLSIIIVGICFLIIGFNIFFRKDGKFPETEVGHNKAMREKGIKCTRSVAYQEHREFYNHKARPMGGCGGCS